MFHILHIYKLNMKNVSISLSTITYKRHINIVVCTQYDDLCAVPLTVKCFYLIKIFFLQRKCIMFKVSYSWTYLMPHLQFISLVTLAWFEIWASRMGFCHYSDKCVDSWMGYFLTSQKVSKCSNKNLHLGSNYSFMLLGYFMSEALWHVTNAILNVWIFIHIW